LASVASSPNDDQKNTQGDYSLVLRRIAKADATQLSRGFGLRDSIAWRGESAAPVSPLPSASGTVTAPALANTSEDEPLNKL
jgi:hypothetical protein